MSNRDSLGVGDLIPQDVVDIFAHEKHSRRSQKKRSHSLGRALVWLKGRKKRDASAKRGSPGLGPALDLAVEVRPPGHHGGHKGGPRSGRQAHPQGNGHGKSRQDAQRQIDFTFSVLYEDVRTTQTKHINKHLALNMQNYSRS